MSERGARIVEKQPGEWTNKHGNFSQPIRRLYDVWNPPPPNTDGWSDLRLTVAALQGLIRAAFQDQTRLRALGGGWSLSKAAATEGYLVNTKPLNWRFPLGANHVLPQHQATHANLLFAQCGTSIAELNTHLARQERSLKTSGASNGQTIVGAMSTGTHGSAREVGSVQDYVLGLHLISGADRHVWLERASQPVVSQEFIDRLGAELVRDDTLFDAAVVSFGSFGIIHAALIETEPIYLLESYRQRRALDQTLRQAMNTLTFTDLALPDPGTPPFHFEVVVNPHDVPGGAYVTIMYKRPYFQGYQPPPESSGGFGPGDDVLTVIGTLSDEIPALLPFLVNSLVARLYMEYGPVWGTHGEIFSATNSYGKATSTEIAVPAHFASQALDCLLAAHNETGPFGGVFAFRFVRQSSALLAFTKFPMNCTIELPGVASRRSDQFFERVWHKLEEAGIPFTLHWGQQNHFTPARVGAMYGPAVAQWVQSRQQLMGAPARRAFSNDFLEQCGLAV